MIKKIRNSSISKYISAFLAVSMIFQISFPLTAYALTGGPSQPEVQSFEPVGTSEMVDLFSGDFNYNIPLLDVGGYPVNISYHSGITADQEASWVGLGWNINPGVINRNMRGVPDDFNGEEVKKEFNIKGNRTIGLTATFGTELTGVDKEALKVKPKALDESGLGSVGFSLGLNYNNYTGVGFEIGISPGISAGDKNKGALTAGLGLSASSEGGVGINPTIGLERERNKKVGNEIIGTNSSLTIGLPFNSRSGFSGLTLSADRKRGLYEAAKNAKGEDVRGDKKRI
jgi:hypothetical protein